MAVTARFRDGLAPSVSAPTPGSGVRNGTISCRPRERQRRPRPGRVPSGADAGRLGRQGAVRAQLRHERRPRDGAKSMPATAVDTAGNRRRRVQPRSRSTTRRPTSHVTSGPQRADVRARQHPELDVHRLGRDERVGRRSSAASSPPGSGELRRLQRRNGSTRCRTGPTAATPSRSVPATRRPGWETTARARSRSTRRRRRHGRERPGRRLVLDGHRRHVRLQRRPGRLDVRVPRLSGGANAAGVRHVLGGGLHTATGFSPGTYSFEVRATDPYGNTDASPAKRTFTVTAPARGPIPAPARTPAPVHGTRPARPRRRRPPPRRPRRRPCCRSRPAY